MSPQMWGGGRGVGEGGAPSGSAGCRRASGVGPVGTVLGQRSHHGPDGRGLALRQEGSAGGAAPVLGDLSGEAGWGAKSEGSQ